jgi:hypothetical protein
MSPRRRAKPKRRRVERGLAVRVTELDAVRRELERVAARSPAKRWNPKPEDVERSVAQLVLTLVEFLRKLMERQAVRRMGAGTLTPREVERVGTALMKLERTVADLARRFDLRPEDLNLDLGVAKLL